MIDYSDRLMEAAVESASGPELTLYLYDGAIRFANDALIHLENDEYDRALEPIARVADIIQEFQITLDHQYEIAEPLNDLYRYMYRRLCEATVNESNSHTLVTEVRDMLREFRDTWEKAMKLAVH